MRVLYVHEQFGAFAGAEANVLATGSALARRGHAVALAHQTATRLQEEPWRETFARRFNLESTPGRAGIEAAVEQFAPDVVFVHKISDLDVLGALAESRVPVVRMVHDHELYCMRRYKYSYWSRRVCNRGMGLHCLVPCGAFLGRRNAPGLPVRWVSYTAKQRELSLNRRFARMVVATEYMKAELLRNGFDADRIDIHPPVPQSPAAAVQSCFGSRNRIVFAGQLIRGKGVDVLLRALARVSVPFECWIFGDGNHRGYCQALSRRLGLQNRVVFAGFIPADEVRHFYHDCTVAVLSSVWPEPFGAVGLEAMRCGLPVVAFDAGGIREWLIDGRNGFLVPWMDCAAFAARVEQLLTDKALARRMGECGRADAEQRFSFEGYIRRLEELLARVRARPPAPAAAPLKVA